MMVILMEGTDAAPPVEFRQAGLAPRMTREGRSVRKSQLLVPQTLALPQAQALPQALLTTRLLYQCVATGSWRTDNSAMIIIWSEEMAALQGALRSSISHAAEL